MEQVNIFGLMEEYIKDNGKIINYMEEAFIHGQMVVDMKVNMKMIRKVAMVHI